ncbi:MAG: Gfo/Idh/MocA family oxidoreductase [Acetanaerobacterium sp.]
MHCQFLLVGSGWRAEFFLRAAMLLPSMFSVTGVVTQNPKMAQRYSEWGFICRPSIDDALAARAKPDFAVVSVQSKAQPGVVLDLLGRGLPVLEETPAAPSLDALVEMAVSIPHGAKLQVAEQYHLRPDHAARINILRTGKLGRPVQALVSLTNNYHAISLIRRYLGISGIEADIRAQRFSVKGMPGHGRDGAPSEERPTAYPQTLATLDFGDALGIYNFEEAQHRSYIRSQHIQIKCERGEIDNNHIKYLLDYHTSMETPLLRRNKGEDENMEGAGLKGIIADGAWVYENPFHESRMTDDEIAVTECLARMAAYCAGGPDLYSFAEAAQDAYFSQLIEEAVVSGHVVTAKRQPWTDALQTQR